MDKKRYLRLIYQRTFSYLGAALVIALIAGTLLGGGIYVVWGVIYYFLHGRGIV